MSTPIAIHEFADLDAALEFLKRARWELRSLRYVRVFRDRLRVFDINNDFFELNGVGYLHADIVALLNAVNTAFNPQTVRDETNLEFKQYKTGRRYTWAQDRVM